MLVIDDLLPSSEPPCIGFGKRPGNREVHQHVVLLAILWPVEVLPQGFYCICPSQTVFRLFRLRPPEFALPRSSSFGAFATVREWYLPIGETRGRRNSRLHSLRGRRFRTAPGMSGASSDGRVHDAR